MRKYLLILLTMVFAWSCTNRPDDIFDDSSANRFNAAVKECNDILKAQDQGWILQYYPEAAQSYGGFNMFLKFSAGDKVEIGSEADITGTKESLYSLGGDYGLTLNFDTYNEYLHYFSDPNTSAGGGDGFGYEGDYEFRVNKYAATDIELVGKKTINKMKMVPLSSLGYTNWDEYAAAVMEVRKNLKSYYYTEIDGTRYDLSVYTSKMILLDSEGSNTTNSEAWIPTAKGIKLYEPMQVGGKTFSEFVLDPVTFSLTETTTQTVLTADIPVDYLPISTFAGNWRLSFTIGLESTTVYTRDIVFTPDESTGRVTVSGLLENNWTFYFTYNSASGRIEYGPQTVAEHNGMDLRLCCASFSGADGFTLWRNGANGFDMKWNMDTSNMVFSFNDLKNYPADYPLHGFALWYQKKDGTTGGQYSTGAANYRQFFIKSLTKL